MTDSRKKLSVILPVYNEEGAISKIIDQIYEVLTSHNYDFEIVVVDDASTDNTVGLIADRGLRIVRHKIRRGSGAARKTGMMNARGDTVVMLDADGTYSAGDIPRLLKYIDEYEQVVGVRRNEYGPLKFVRFIAKWLIRKVACFLTKTKIDDLNSGMRAFRRDVLLKYLYLLPDGFSCTTTITLAFICNGYPIKYVPIEYKPRIGNSKFRPFRDTGNYLLTVIRMVMYFDPLRIFLPLSLTIFIIGVLKTLYDVYFGIKDMQESDIVILIAALLIFILGLLADLIIVQGRKQKEI